MIDILSTTLFGNEAGEDEPTEILNSYFFDKPSFKSFYSDSQKFMIVRSRKGVGKSALLKYTQSRISSQGSAITVYVKGSDLTSIQAISGEGPSDLINGWQQRLCTRIALEIGKNLKLALTDDTITLVEQSELSGFKERNIVSAIFDRLKFKLSKAEIDITKLVSSDTKAILERYSKDQNIEVWLFIDDIDATFLNREDQRLLISTFFSACRNIVNNVNGLYIRASVRTDVWSIISQEDEALDKCEQYVLDVTWSTSESGLILKNKILSYFQREYPNRNIYKNWNIKDNERVISDLVFKGPFLWGAQTLPPYRPIHILSGGRPRWATQLCKLAAKHAVSNNRSKIMFSDVEAVLVVYGRSRLLDIFKD